jgi:hypothetical protein
MTADCGLRGLDLLDLAIEHIEQHPETWVQRKYRCGTTMCLSGWICELAGGRWADSGDGPYQEYLLAEPGDASWRVLEFRGTGVVGAWDRAERLLGFSPDMDEALGGTGDGRDLFDGYNNLDDIKAMRDALRAKLAEVTR